MDGGGNFVLVREDIERVEDTSPDNNEGCESVLVLLNLYNAKTLEHGFFL